MEHPNDTLRCPYCDSVHSEPMTPGERALIFVAFTVSAVIVIAGIGLIAAYFLS